MSFEFDAKKWRIGPVNGNWTYEKHYDMGFPIMGKQRKAGDGLKQCRERQEGFYTALITMPSCILPWGIKVHRRPQYGIYILMERCRTTKALPSSFTGGLLLGQCLLKQVCELQTSLLMVTIRDGILEESGLNSIGYIAEVLVWHRGPNRATRGSSQPVIAYQH